MWLIIGFSGKLDLSKFKHAQRIWLKRLIVFQRNELSTRSLDHTHNTRDLVCFSKMTLVSRPWRNILFEAALSQRMGRNQFCSICFEGEIASSSHRVHHSSVGHRDLSLFTLCYETKSREFAFFKLNNVWLPGFFFVHAETKWKNIHRNPFI